MSNLIITIIGAALFIVVSVGGISYIDEGTVYKRQNEELVKTGFIKFVSEYQIYKMNNKTFPLSIAGWSNSINKIRPPNNTAWSYENNSDGNYFCLSGTINDSSFFHAVKNILSKNFNSVFVGDTCGVTSDNDSFVEGGFKAFTLWLDSNYVSKKLVDSDAGYNLDMYFRDYVTGNIIDYDRIVIYKDIDYLLRVDVNNVDINMTINQGNLPTGAEAKFVCSDGSDGCNVGASRIVKISSPVEFKNVNLIFKASYSSGFSTRSLSVDSTYVYICNETNPLQNIDNVSGNYLIGNSVESSDIARDQLLCLSQNQTPAVLSSNYKLMANVDFGVDKSLVDWDGDSNPDGASTEGWIPLGNTSDFIGGFDGNNYKIINLYINRDAERQGLFSNLNTVQGINNLTLENIDITGKYIVGGLAGYSKADTNLTNIHVSGKLESTSSYGTNQADVGGLLGINEGSSVHQSSTNVNITSTADDIGGLIGMLISSTSSITECKTEGNITGRYGVGGIVGFFDGNAYGIRDSYSNANVTSDSYAGGIIGVINGSNDLIYNSYSAGIITAGSNSGALIGGTIGGAATAVESYAINDSITAISYRGYDINNYCSYNADAGCDISYASASIKGAWLDSVWEDLAEEQPKLEWEVLGNIDSEYIAWQCESTNPLLNIEQDGSTYLLGGVDGSSIYAKDQLLCLSQNQNNSILSASYRLTADVVFDSDETTIDWDGNGVADGVGTSGWTPLGTLSNSSFSGIFDGNGHTIDNLYVDVDKSSDTYAGFFGYVSSGEVRNITISNADMKAFTDNGYVMIGVLVGNGLNGSTFDNVYVSGTVSGNSTGHRPYVGGAVGQLYDSYLTDVHAVVDVSVNSNGVDYSYAGGLIGIAMHSNISESHSSGDVDLVATGTHRAGGLIGYLRSNVNSSYSSGNVTSTGRYTGGLVGYFYGESVYSINNCYATGSVSGNSYIGGLIGNVNTGEVRNSYATGNISGSSNVGGLFGGSSTPNVTRSYAINNTYSAIGNQTYDLNNYCSWSKDFGCTINYDYGSIKEAWSDTIWEQLADNTPKLEWEVAGDIDSEIVWECNTSDPLQNIEIDIDSYYLIGGSGGATILAKKQLLCLSENENGAVRIANLRLMADISFNADETQEDWNFDGTPDGIGTQGWQPIGNSSNRYLGNFDGNGFSISNLYINRTSNYQGLFGYVQYSEIKDIKLIDAEITGNSYSSPLVGYAREASIINASSEGVNVNGGQYSSGLIGYVNASSIEKAYTTGTVNVSSNNNSGGLVGMLTLSSSIDDSYSTVTVSGRQNIGGLIGRINESSVSDSYATGGVTGIGTNVAGLVGNATSSSTIDNCYYTGIVNSSAARLGGLVGNLDSSSIDNSYATGAVSAAGLNNIGGLVGRMTNGSSVDNSYASSSVNGNRGVGGLIGYANGNGGALTITNSYAYWTSAPSGSTDVGGLIGRVSGTWTVNNTDNVCEYVDESGYPSQCVSSDIFTIHGSFDPARIISDGTNDYIDTGLDWTPTTKVVIEGKGATSSPGTYDKMTGTLNNYTWFGHARGYFYYGQGSSSYHDWQPYDTNDHVFIIDLLNNTLYFDSNTLSYTGNKPNGRPLFIFARENGGSPYQHMAFNLLKAEVWQDGILVRDFKPQLDGTLLDEVNNVYYSNSGYGSFGVEGGTSTGWNYYIWNDLGSNVTPTLK